MPLALIQELLLALLANDPDDFKAWLSLGIERLGKVAVIERWSSGWTRFSRQTKRTGWGVGT